MPKSRIDCIHIKEIGCQFFDENRLCPDDCKGFKNGTLKIEEKIVMQEQEQVLDKRRK
jgi:hypothetical protein